MNIENVPKLMTKEDPYHIHKTLGIVSIIHFAYRYGRLFTNQSMDFTTNYDIAFLIIHALLSTTSLNFKIPQSRNKASPMIYPEFRLHNLLFSYRSLLCTLFFYYRLPIIYNIFACYMTMIGADIVSKYYKDGTTMRSMQFDANVSEESQKTITMFHTKMQLCATTYMIGNIDSAFSPLFAIQLSSFLMTLVRKNIIKTNHWHLLYGFSLIMNVFVYYSLRFDYIVFQLFVFKLFSYLRLTKQYDKYACWSLVYGLFMIYQQYPYTIPYEDTLKTLFILKYLFKYIPIFF